VFKTALFWLGQGAELVPIQPGSKAIVAGFGVYLKRISTEQQAKFWFNDRACNLGVVCAGGLCCLDFDDVSSYQRVAGSLAGLLTEKTKRGYHVFCFTSGKWTAQDFEILQSNVVTCAPSVVGGVRYEQLGGYLKAFDLSQVASELLSLSDRSKASYQPAGNSSDTVTRCKAALDIIEVAQELQQARGLPSLKEKKNGFWVGRCPFHSEHRASYYVSERGFYGCHSCGARGDVLNLWQALYHISTIEQAIADVASKVLL